MAIIKCGEIPFLHVAKMGHQQCMVAIKCGEIPFLHVAKMGHQRLSAA
jgi:hypothetical protein